MAPNGEFLSRDIQPPNSATLDGMDRTKPRRVARMDAGAGFRFPLSERTRNQVRRSSAASFSDVADPLAAQHRFSKKPAFKTSWTYTAPTSELDANWTSKRNRSDQRESISICRKKEKDETY